MNKNIKIYYKMTDNLFYNFMKIFGILFFVFFIVFILVKSFKMQLKVMEGLTGSSTSSTTSSTTSVAPGQGGSASNYASEIKNLSIQMQDSLLISKYRTDYENVVINLDQYISLLMLQNALKFDTSSSSSSTNMEVINNLNSLNNVSNALNSVMKFIDSQ